MSFVRTGQLRELQNMIEEISRAIMWVNEREEEELVFNWGDKNIDVYIPKKQESYSVRLYTDIISVLNTHWSHVTLPSFVFTLLSIYKLTWEQWTSKSLHW